jgi:hypothetical protein
MDNDLKTAKKMCCTCSAFQLFFIALHLIVTQVVSFIPHHTHAKFALIDHFKMSFYLIVCGSYTIPH